MLGPLFQVLRLQSMLATLVWLVPRYTGTCLSALHRYVSSCLGSSYLGSSCLGSS